MIREFATLKEWEAEAKRRGLTVELQASHDYPHPTDPYEPVVAYAGSPNPLSADWQGEVGYYDQYFHRGYLADSNEEWLIYCNEPGDEPDYSTVNDSADGDYRTYED